jgi:endoglucanase Acf2
MCVMSVLFTNLEHDCNYSLLPGFWMIEDKNSSSMGKEYNTNTNNNNNWIIIIIIIIIRHFKDCESGVWYCFYSDCKISVLSQRIKM